MQISPPAGSETSRGLQHGWLWLCAAVLLIYAQVGTHEFNNYDDTTYITRNPYVTGGLTREGVTQAFCGTTLGMWHPLTSLSHMLDWQFFGSWAGGHVAVNVLLHAFNASLLFLLLRRMTGRAWVSFAVALLFAVHPLNVESVAWASQRKTVLSGFFFLLTLLAWQRYKSGKSIPVYLLALGLYALGLMSKPILVTLPGILLLLDVWPLESVKWTVRSLAGLVLEKIPFALLALAAVAILLHPWGQATTGAAPTLEFTSESWMRATANIVVYLRRVCWPSDLAVLYPHRPIVPATELVGAVAVLSLVSVLAWRRRWPVLIGWLWFLGSLFPVSGVVPIGPHEQADRYAYLSGIGIFLMAAWLVPPGFWSWRHGRTAVVIMAVALGLIAWRQTATWRNSLTLWSRAVALYPPSVVQQLNYGSALAGVGRLAEAEQCFELVARFRPGDPEAYINLATILNQRGEKQAAIALLERALRVAPKHARAHGLLGSYLQDVGRLAEARASLETAIRLDPHLGSAHLDLGVLLVQEGDLSGAERCFVTATQIQPEDPAAWQNLALVRAQLAARQKRGIP